MFTMTDKNINNLDGLNLEILKDPTVGGIVYFQGVVRNHNEGKDVTSLEYDSYVTMANKVGADIIALAKEKFDIVDIYCLHRTGHLEINDTAVWCVATSHHRREAFEACQFVVDTVKEQVPIWKREHYVTEDPKWVACHRCLEHANEAKIKHSCTQHHHHSQS